MPALTPAQLKKLTPAERKKREERLAYNRKYQAAQREKKGQTKKASKKSSSTVRSAKAQVAEVTKMLPRYDVDALGEKLKRLQELYSQIETLSAEIKGDIA